MPRVQNSIRIHADPDRIFCVTNDLERWPELFNEYAKVRILSHERCGRFARIEFELTNREGQSWRSWRYLDYQDRIAVAQRIEPMYPFRFMHLTWRYTPVADGVEMTWIMDFELDPGAPYSLDHAVNYMYNHAVENQKRFKRILEAEANNHGQKTD